MQRKTLLSLTHEEFKSRGLGVINVWELLLASAKYLIVLSSRSSVLQAVAKYHLLKTTVGTAVATHFNSARRAPTFGQMLWNRPELRGFWISISGSCGGKSAMGNGTDRRWRDAPVDADCRWMSFTRPRQAQLRPCRSMTIDRVYSNAEG